MTSKKHFDVWSSVTIGMTLFYIFFLLLPLGMIFYQSFFDKETGQVSGKYWVEFFSEKYYFQTLWNSFAVSITVTVLAILIGAPMGYFFSVYRLHGKKIMEALIIIAQVSAPFISAYSWILLFGNSGLITKIFSNAGVELPSVYGFWGIVLVLTFKTFPLIFLYVVGAMKNIDSTLLEASRNLGDSPIKTFFTIVLPLLVPTILGGSVLVFMRSMSDFGTPSLIGGSYRTFPVLIYNEFMSEISGDDGFASTIAIISIIIMAMVFLTQSFISRKLSFNINSLHPIQEKKPKLVPSIFIYLYICLVIAIAVLPQVYVIYTSFLKTSGLIFVDGYSFESYTTAFRLLGNSAWNTFLIPFLALIFIVLLSVLIAYVTVRKRNTFTKGLEISTIIPYIIPGSVLGIAFAMTFKTKYLAIPAFMLIVIALILRRMQYTLRSSTAVLQQIPLSTEEASRSLGANKMTTFFKITMPMMKSGILSGAILSWISLITELSSSIILYTTKTETLTVAIYTQVLRGKYGVAAALSTVLTIFTVASVLLSIWISDKQKKTNA